MNDVKLSVDAVLFGYQQGLKILLIQRKFEPYQSNWALPGGFLLDNESLEEAVNRELKEETGVELALNRLEQLYTFGSVDRDPRGRVVSVVFLGMVNPKGLSLEASTDAAAVKWFSLENLPELAFDHGQMVKLALERLRSKLSYAPMGFDLLNNEFLFSELEQLYQSVLGRDIDRRNFRKKLLALNLVEETGNQRSEGKGRPGSLYRFNEKVYFQLLEEKKYLQLF